MCKQSKRSAGLVSVTFVPFSAVHTDPTIKLFFFYNFRHVTSAGVWPVFDYSLSVIGASTTTLGT